MFERNIFFLGSVSEIHFRERALVFGVLLRHCVFLVLFLHTCVVFVPENAR